MRIRIGHKIAAFSALIIALAAFVGYQAIQASARYVVYREKIDLQDEAVARGHDLLEKVRLFREDILRLSTGEFGGTQFVTAEQGVDADKARVALQKLLSQRRDYLWVATLELKENGSIRPGPLAAAQSAVSLDQIPRSFLKELGRSGPFEVRLSRVSPLTTAVGRTSAVLWAAVHLASRDGRAERSNRFIVAALDLGPMLDILDTSPRHVTFLTQGEDYYLLHPNRHMSLGAGREGRTPLSQGQVFRLPDEAPTGAVSALRWGFGRYSELLAADSDSRDIERTGWLVDDFRLMPDVALWYQQSEPIDARRLAEPERVDEIDRYLQQYQRQPEFVRRFGPYARLGGLSQAVGRVRFRAGSREKLAELAAFVQQTMEERWQIDLPLEPPVDCRTFTLHFFKLNYDPVDGDYFGLVQAVSNEEISAEALAEMKPITTSVALALLAVAAAALLFTWRLTRPLRDITSAARSFGASDVHSETWSHVVPEIKRQLPVRRQDEIGLLAATFLRMVDEIARSHEELREERNLLDRRVEERTAELKATNQELLLARDAAESANRATERFVASVSHELRTPLNHIMGFCQLLELTELDPQQQDDLAKIRHAGKYLLGLVNDILDYQRIIMGVVDLELEEFAVAPFLGEIADAMRARAAENRNTLRVECAADAGTLTADPKRVRQIVLNLLTNACKFTHDGTITVGCAREGHDGAAWVRLTVADTGRGMSPEQQKRIFTPFAKLADRQGNKDGTGLGLVITKGFCERMGGNISFESIEGKGTTFTIRLPARVPDHFAHADGAPSHAPLRPLPATSGANGGAPAERRSNVVLVVDDDANIRDLMRRFLEQRGFAVRTAASGEEGLQLAKELRPCAITLDAVMPGMDGWEMLAALKTNEQTAAIPVVMVTMLDSAGKGFSLGVSDYLVKPVDWDLLAATLHKYDGTPGTVLIVDDDAELRHMLRRVLEEAGWTVHEAANGRVGLERLRAVHPTVVLLDLMMPELDGFEFVEQARQDARVREIPILVLTARDPTPDERRRLNGGVERILQKGGQRPDEVLHSLHERLAKSLCPDSPTPAATPDKR